jgi:hypothetical protein
MGAWLQIAHTGSRSDVRLVAENGNDLLFRVVPPTGRQAQPEGGGYAASEPSDPTA